MRNVVIYLFFCNRDIVTVEIIDTLVTFIKRVGSTPVISATISV